MVDLRATILSNKEAISSTYMPKSQTFQIDEHSLP